jgi:3-oxoacyl-[acyl-carrier-protein] synthase II
VRLERIGRALENLVVLEITRAHRLRPERSEALARGVGRGEAQLDLDLVRHAHLRVDDNIPIREFSENRAEEIHGMTSRVVITGIGVVSPIGSSRAEFWQACLAGRSGACVLETPWVHDTGLATRIAAPVRGYTGSDAGIDLKQERVLDRTAVFAIGAAAEALRDAGLKTEPDPERRGQLLVHGVPPERLATVVGSGIGGLTSFEASHAIWRETRSKDAVKRYSLPMLIPNAPAGQVAIRFGARAECKALSTACAAGTMAIGDAWRLLRAGEADVVLAGGAEGVVLDEDAYGLMGFDRLRTLSTRNAEPERASRPFDRDRDGFVLGEGAAILVLEREEHAAARGAAPYAAIAGYSTNCDAHSMMALDESGDSIVALIRTGLQGAGIAVEDVDYISAHGTSTPLNDKTESLALRRLFGPRCDRLPVTGLKSMTGHAIGASGPIETAAAALSLREGVLAPTINYEHPDPECNVDVVANRPRKAQAHVCLKLSYGFGGHNACLVLTRP